VFPAEPPKAYVFRKGTYRDLSPATADAPHATIAQSAVHEVNLAQTRPQLLGKSAKKHEHVFVVEVVDPAGPCGFAAETDSAHLYLLVAW